MKKLKYEAPELEIIEVEVEGMIAASIAKPFEPQSNSSTSIIKGASSTYSMDDYDWK